MRKRWLLISLIVFILLFAIAAIFLEFFITRQVEDRIAIVVRNKLNLTSTPQVKVSAHPILLKIYQGRIDSIVTEIANAPFDQTNIEKVVVNIKNLQFDFSLLMREGELAIIGADSAQVRIIVSESEVGRYLQSYLPGSKVRLERGKVRYTGTFSFLGQSFNLDLWGRVVLENNNSVSFRPDRESIDRLTVPEAAKDYLVESLSFKAPIPNLPANVSISSLKVESGKLTVTGIITNFRSFRLGG